jgi:hypothetical protein
MARFVRGFVSCQFPINDILLLGITLYTEPYEVKWRAIYLLVPVLATDPEARVRFPALPEKKCSGSGTGSTQPREYN